MGERIQWDVTDSDPAAAESTGGFASPQPGVYAFKISEVTKKGSGGDPNKPMLEVILEVKDAQKSANKEFIGSRIWYYVLLPGHPSYNGFPVQKADQFWLATGVATHRKRKGSVNTDDLLGMTVGGVVRAGTNLDGAYRGEIASLHAWDDEAWNGTAREEDEDEEDMPPLPDEEDEDEEETSDEEEDADEEEETYDDWSVADLKAELDNRGLTTVGKKSSLVARLEKDDEGADEADFPLKKKR